MSTLIAGVRIELYFEGIPMKIRTDFVTNSSSVSYILTMKKDIVENYLIHFNGWFKQGEDKIGELLKRFMLKKGTRVYIEEEEIYTYKIQFSTDEIQDDSSLELSPKEMDFSSMNEDDLWAYLFGEYILNKRLNNIEGFGITKIETY